MFDCDIGGLSRYHPKSYGGEILTVPDQSRQDRLVDDVDSLLLAVAGGDRSAFAKLYQLTARRLFPIALRMARSKEMAEDILQDAYLAIWRHAASYRPGEGKPLAWMGAIVRNRAIDRLRSDQSRERDLVAWNQEVDNQPASPIMAGGLPDQMGVTLRQCLERLQENHRKAVLLAYYYGSTHEELAKQLDSPLGTVKSWVRRGLSQMKDCIDS